MTERRPARAVGLMLLFMALAAAFAFQGPASSQDTRPAAMPRAEHPGAFGEAGGAIPAGTTVFAEDVRGVRKLDRDLRAALRRASADAGIDFVVDSGWRSPAYQARLLEEAVSKYGSEAEAARWVARPNRSAHVSGDAVDLGSAGAAWLSANGAGYGLCQVYANEPWHYELRPEATVQGCPPAYADPTQDPRLR